MQISTKIDLRTDRVSYTVGYQGENNKRQLLIIPPRDLDGADYFMLAFSLPEGVFRPPLQLMPPIAVMLGSQVTSQAQVSMTLEGYLEGGTILGKAHMVILHFLEAVTGEEWDLTGPAGPQGEPGPQGIPGQDGPKGDTGDTGPQGIQGPQGETGETGPQGVPGLEGPQGIPGIQGEKGDTGDIGPQGPAGAQGDKGEPGDIGPQGSQGIPGEAGPQGLQGVQGEAGPTGPQGETGDTGPAGPQGYTGPPGPQGETGAVGPQGYTGPQGQKGDTGDSGLQGDPGPKGDTGETGPAGPKGDTGATGAQGPPGPNIPDLLTRRLLTENTDYTASTSDNIQSTFHPGQSYSVDFGGYQFTLLEDHWHQNDYVPQPISDWFEGLRVTFSQIGVDQDVTLTPGNTYVLEDYASFTLSHIAQNGDVFEFFGEIVNDWNGYSTQFMIRFISYTPDDPNDVNDTVILDSFAWETEDFTETKNLGQLLTLDLVNPATALDSFDIQLAGSIAEAGSGNAISPFGLCFRTVIGSNSVELLKDTQGIGDFAIVRVQTTEDNGALVLLFDATPSLGGHATLSNIQAQQIVRTAPVEN